MSTWFTSDTHFGHRLVSEIRKFTSTAEHDEFIVANWNELVQPDDLVWHLGDVGLGNDARILETVRQLNGRKQLITGNHDRCWPGSRDSRKYQRAWLEAFESVQAFARVHVNGEKIMLSHFPYHGDHTEEDRASQYRLRDEGAWLIHGHLHTTATVTGPRSIHVGQDAWNLKPVPVMAIAQMIHAARLAEVQP